MAMHPGIEDTRPPRDREMVPRFLLRAVATLVVATLVAVTWARLTDRPLEAVPPEGPVAQERLLTIDAHMSGAARVFDGSGTLVADLGPSEGGFVSGVARALARVRLTHNVAPDAPVRLVRYADGRLALFDPLTDWRVELIGFGPDNTAAFARLMQ